MTAAVDVARSLNVSVLIDGQASRDEGQFSGSGVRSSLYRYVGVPTLKAIRPTKAQTVGGTDIYVHGFDLVKGMAIPISFSTRF